MSHPLLTALKLAAGSAALVLALAGCSAGPAASNSSGASGASSDTPEEHEAKYQEWELKLAQCFRDKGIDVEDPTPEGGWPEVTQEMQDVSPECQAEIGEPPVRQLSEAEKKQADQTRFEYDTKLGDCLRDLGYDIADAKLGGVSPEIPESVSMADLETCSAAAVQ